MSQQNNLKITSYIKLNYEMNNISLVITVNKLFTSYSNHAYISPRYLFQLLTFRVKNNLPQQKSLHLALE